MIEKVNEMTGEKEFVFTADEIKANQDALVAKETELAEAKRVAEERGQNFSEYNKKTEKLEGEVKSLKTTLEEKTAREIASAKSDAGLKYHGNNEELKTKLEQSYALVNMPENTPQEIAARMEAASRMAGIVLPGGPSPLTAPMYGEPPQQKKARAEEAEFLQSEKGQAALKAMGIEEAPKQ